MKLFVALTMQKRGMIADRSAASAKCLILPLRVERKRVFPHGKQALHGENAFPSAGRSDDRKVLPLLPFRPN